jgi:integrating conjugative element relaxase (TIGR03760 family)
MFIQPTKKIISPDAKPLASLTAVLSAEQLLSETKRQTVISELMQFSEFKSTHFNHLCVPLLQQVASAYQRLPESTVHFALPGGLFDHALARTQTAVQLFRQYLLHNPKEALSDEQKRWWYVLFSASLLRGIGSLCLDYRIDRYSVKGQFLKQWEPLLEPFGNVNHFYAFEFKTNDDYALRRRLTLLLARRFIPEEGFAWIAANQDALAVWLALLDEDQTGARELGAILDRADAVIIQENLLHLSTMPRRERTARLGTFVDATPELSLPEKERIAGIEFMRWLQQNIETGKFLLNRAPIFVVPGGLLICVEAFQLFMREHVSYKNWQTVQHGLLSLKVHRSIDANTATSRHEQGDGVVIKNSIALPESLSIKKTTEETVQTTATALALMDYPNRLSQTGAWAVPEKDIASTLQHQGRIGG